MEAMYEMECTLYEGRTSVVHKAVHRKTGDDCAIKTYSRSGGVDTSIEIQILSSLQPHPNICAVREVNRAPGSETKLVMDYYQTFLPKQGRTAPSDVRHVAVQVLNALSYMHEKQMAHLGIQPKNVMCRVRDSSVKLIHFKRACYLDAKQKMRIAPDSGPGLRYDAPEILVGDVCTPAADVWSFGCLIGEMIAGKPLFSGSNPAMVLSSIVNAVGMPTARLVSEMKGKPEFRAVLTDLKARPPANSGEDSPLKLRFQELLQDDFPLLRALISCLSIDPSVRPTMRELMHHQAFNVSVKPSPQLYMIMPSSPRGGGGGGDLPMAPMTPGYQEEGGELSPSGQYPQGAAGLLGRRVSQVRRADSRGRDSGSGSDMEGGVRQSVPPAGGRGAGGRFSENGGNLSSWRTAGQGQGPDGLPQVPGAGVGPPPFARDRQMSYLQRASQNGTPPGPGQLKLDVQTMAPMPPQPPNGKPLLTHNRSVRVSEPGIRPPPGAVPEPLPQAYYAEGYQQQRVSQAGKPGQQAQGPDRRLLFVEYGGRVSSAAPPGYGMMVDQYGNPMYPPQGGYPPGQMPPGMAPGQVWPGYPPQPGMPGYPAPAQEGSGVAGAPGAAAAPGADAAAGGEQGDGMDTALSSPRAGNNDYSEFSAEKEAMLHEVAMAAVQKAALGAALRAAQSKPGEEGDLAVVSDTPTHYLSVTFMPKVAAREGEEGEEEADTSQATPEGLKTFAEGGMVQAKSYTNQSENQDDLLANGLLTHLYLTPESTITQAMSNLIGLKNICELTIASDETEGAPQYAILQGLEHMTRLCINCLGVKNQASHINMLSISCCTQIVRLELEDYCLSSANSIKLLVSMPKLRYLGARQLEPEADVFLQKPCTLTELFIHQMPTSDQLLKLPLASVTEIKTAEFKWRLGVGGSAAAVGAAAQQIQQATNILGPRLVSNTYDPVWDKHHVSPFLIWDEIPAVPAANVIAALNPMASKLRELRLQKWLVDEELVHAMVVAGPNLELLKVDRCNVTSKAWAALVSLVHLKTIEMLSEVKVSDLIAYAVAAAKPAAIKICETRISHIELESCVDMIRGCREAYQREPAVIVRHKYW